jgi:hypothetical protein
MTHRVRTRFWLETTLAGVTFAALLLTLISRDWIETVFGVDPDHHSGSLEWAIVAVSLAASVSLATLAAKEWRRVVTT